MEGATLINVQSVGEWRLINKQEDIRRRIISIERLMHISTRRDCMLFLIVPDSSHKDPIFTLAVSAPSPMINLANQEWFSTEKLYNVTICEHAISFGPLSLSRLNMKMKFPWWWIIWQVCIYPRSWYQMASGSDCWTARATTSTFKSPFTSIFNRLLCGLY